jgi:hypothetical protein
VPQKDNIFVDDNHSIKVDIPQFPVSLPGSFWGLTTFFNPAGYKNKIENYRLFRRSSARQGLKLLAVELAFGDAPFELVKADADILIQLRTDADNILWQKERLLNVGLKHLPDDCDKFAWLDCDIIFKNDRWIEESAAALTRYAFIQPFSFIVRQPRGVLLMERFDDLPLGKGDGERMRGIAYSVACEGKDCLRKTGLYGEPGYAWVSRKNIIGQCGFYDRLITGSGDLITAHSFFDAAFDPLEKEKLGRLVPDYNLWRTTAYKQFKDSVAYIDGCIVHLWHGTFARRKYYLSRHQSLNRHDFDQEQDIKISANGVWEWASDKKELHKEIKEYFYSREECKP